MRPSDKSRIYNLLEVANVHEGDFSSFISLIREFEDLSSAQGIKVQVFRARDIALPGYEWFETYKELEFNNLEWSEIIKEVIKSKDCWIDVFDDYSLEILEENKKNVFGIKLQSSILANADILSRLCDIDLSTIKMIVNVSGIERHEIRRIVTQVQDRIEPNKLIIQAGFQSYPTKTEDSALGKIQVLLNEFDLEVSFADHADATGEDSTWLPVFGALSGATLIEKHIRPSGELPKYDFYSALERKDYEKYILRLNRYLSAAHGPFINANESKYLASTIQIPVLKNTVRLGQTLSLSQDMKFRRSNIRGGLSYSGLEEKTGTFYVVAKDLKENDVVREEELKKATIGTIIACRLKSSRLPGKALEKIGDLSSVELCIKNCLKFEEVHHTILATSDLPTDSDLADYCYDPSVIFHCGDPDDVIQRYLDIIDRLKIDIVVRVTADMPYVSNKILKMLLKSHFAQGADYTTARKAAIGTNLEIINTEALRRIKSYFKHAQYSEYMTWYFKNNPDHFRLNIVELPESLVRQYRLTLDYEEDLRLLNKVASYYESEGIEHDLEHLFAFLDENPELAKINQKRTLKYETDEDLIAMLNRETRIKIPPNDPNLT